MLDELRTHTSVSLILNEVIADVVTVTLVYSVVRTPGLTLVISLNVSGQIKIIIILFFSIVLL